MSYEIVKTIRIKDGKVFINCASNNCYPHDYTEQEYPYFTKILTEQGLQETEIALLKNYEEGNLQGGSNKYTRALKVLCYVLKDEYKVFNWRNHNASYGSEEYKKEKELRESQAFKDLLIKALNTKLPKEKFIVYNTTNGYYVSKETTRHIFYKDLARAKKYDFKEQAERTAEHIHGEVKEVLR